jgi:hypothetical protein
MEKLCEKFNVEVKTRKWAYHLKTKMHLENDPNQIIEQLGNTKLCEKCDVNVAHSAWPAHLRSERLLSNKPDDSRKVCEKCNIELGIQSWSKHTRPKNHLINNPNQIIKPVRPIKRNMPTKLCKKYNVEIAHANCNTWLNHIKSKTHLENEHDNSRKLCEKCDIEVETRCWSKHLKSKYHLENDPYKTIKQLEYTKLCEKCNVKVARRAWDAHLKSETHLENEPDDSRKLC